MPPKSVYLLCKHNHFFDGQFCEECLYEKINERRLMHFENKKMMKDKFLSFAMATHERLGSLNLAPTFKKCTKTTFTGSEMIISCNFHLKFRHCAFSKIPDDILKIIWDLLQADDFECTLENNY